MPELTKGMRTQKRCQSVLVENLCIALREVKVYISSVFISASLASPPSLGIPRPWARSVDLENSGGH